MVQSLLKTIGKFHKALEIKLPYDAAVPLLGIYPEKFKSGSVRDTSTPTLIGISQYPTCGNNINVPQLSIWFALCVVPSES